MRIDRLYETFLKLHAILPYKMGRGFALPLLKIGLELTYQCNLRCVFCFQQQQKGRRERDELTADEYGDLISQIPHYALITFTGGEPLLRRDNLEIIQKALERHWCNIITNGVMMTEQHVKTFVEKRMMLIGVSIDGIGYYHDTLRGMKGAYDKIMYNVRSLQEYKNKKKTKYPMLDIKTVITEENIDMLEDIYHCAVDLDADFFTLSPLKGTDIQFQANFIHTLDDERLCVASPVKPYVDPKVLVRKISNIMKMSRDKKIKIRFYPVTSRAEGMESHFDNSKKLIDRYQPCLIPWSALQISPVGDAYPCIAYKVGNIRESSLKSVWNSPDYREFRKRLSKSGLFPGCVGCCYLYERPHTASAN